MLTNTGPEEPAGHGEDAKAAQLPLRSGAYTDIEIIEFF